MFSCITQSVDIYQSYSSTSVITTLHAQASLIAHLVKNPPAMQETWVGSLGWEDLLEKGKATHSNNLAWRIPVWAMGLQSQTH